MPLTMAEETDSHQWQRLETDATWVEVLTPLLERRYWELSKRAMREHDEIELRRLQGAMEEVQLMLNRPRLEREAMEREAKNGRRDELFWPVGRRPWW